VKLAGRTLRAACRAKPRGGDLPGTSFEGQVAVEPTSAQLSLAGGAIAALTAGLFGSGHCAVMCGPLACVSLDRDPRQRARRARAWQAGRLLAYAALGMALGTFGAGVRGLLAGPARAVLPWIMVAGLVLMAFEVGKRGPRIPGLAHISRALFRAGENISPIFSAGFRGAATAFLPCGLLYGAFVMAIGAGSAVGGAVTMAAFAAGGLPALAVVQAQSQRLAKYPRVHRTAQRLVPLVAAGLIVWRTVATHAGHSCH